VRKTASRSAYCLAGNRFVVRLRTGRRPGHLGPKSAESLPAGQSIHVSGAQPALESPISGRSRETIACEAAQSSRGPARPSGSVVFRAPLPCIGCLRGNLGARR